MMQDGPYSSRDLRNAVILSVVLGWAMVAAPFAIAGGLGLLSSALVVGLPIASLAGLFVVRPMLRRIMARPISWKRAAICGAGVSGVVALCSIVIGRLAGLLSYMNDSSSSQIGSGARISSIDGILTAYGWMLVAQRSAMFIAGGVLIALLLRWIIGPGRQDGPTT